MLTAVLGPSRRLRCAAIAVLVAVVWPVAVAPVASGAAPVPADGPAATYRYDSPSAATTSAANARTDAHGSDGIAAGDSRPSPVASRHFLGAKGGVGRLWSPAVVGVPARRSD
jgi:hypothetical protein